MSTTSSTNRGEFRRLDRVVGVLSSAFASAGPKDPVRTAVSAFSTTAEPGYDRPLQAEEVNLFIERTIFSWPAGSGAPSGGDGENNPEAATPGHL